MDTSKAEDEGKASHTTLPGRDGLRASRTRRGRITTRKRASHLPCDARRPRRIEPDEPTKLSTSKKSVKPSLGPRAHH